VKIAIDAMGGDHAPANIIRGIRLFIDENRDVDFVVVGREPSIREELRQNGLDTHPRIAIRHAEEVIGMEDMPVRALRSKKTASLNVMMDLAKEGVADAVLSAGNTGAIVAAATLKLRTLQGIDRPGIATVIPTPEKNNILMDVGAVTECKVKNLVQFAIMGSSICQSLMEIDSPRIGLLNVGEEETKGNDLTKEVFARLKNSSLRFVGNVEGRDLFLDKADVIVTDGFVGNIVLKACENLAHMLFSVIRNTLGESFRGRLGGLLLKPVFKKIIERFNHEEYGGALLLGVKGVVIISHGSSSPVAIKNAIRLAAKMVEDRVNIKIRTLLEQSGEAS
jgi:glycerol-3-phosphate acyltransferase PlsX